MADPGDAWQREADSLREVRKRLAKWAGQDRRFPRDDVRTLLVAVELFLPQDRKLRQAERVIACDHPEESWGYVERGGKTWNRCGLCGLWELWEGDMLVRRDWRESHEVSPQPDPGDARQQAALLWQDAKNQSGPIYDTTAIDEFVERLAARVQEAERAHGELVKAFKYLIEQERYWLVDVRAKKMAEIARRALDEWAVLGGDVQRVKCPRCADVGEIAATSGQPGDGTMPCPDCQDSLSNTERG